MGAMYDTATPAASSIPAATTTVTGQYLSKNRKTEAERTKLALAVIDGRVVLGKLTVRQIASLCGVPVWRIYRHRDGNGNGRNGGNGRGHGGDVPVVDRVVNATPEEQLEPGRVLGLDWVWDHMIAPLMEIDRRAGQ
jgi:hypothetical protein